MSAVFGSDEATYVDELLVIPDLRIILDDGALGQERDTDRMDAFLPSQHGFDGL